MVLALSPIPLINDRFFIYLGSLFMIYAIYATSYNILFGYAGLVSFGHAIFFASGAYSTALYTLRIYRDPLAGLLVGVLVTIPLALAIGAVTLRHTRIYFSILTLALGMVLYALLIKLRGVTGGSDGLVGIPKKGLLIDISSPSSYYFFIYLFFVLSIFAGYIVMRSRLGLLIRALGANEDRLPFSGHSVFAIRLYTFTISGVLAGLAGSLYAILMGVVTPDIAYWTFSADPLIMTLLGGSGYYLGPSIGALIFLILTTIFARYSDVWMLFFGLAVIGIVLGFRGGIIGFAAWLWEKTSRRETRGV